MPSIAKIEKRRKIRLPEVYKDFYYQCSYSMPPNLVGTDILNDQSDLNEWAVDLLQEDGVENFLELDDLVFMMHQGYMFWYFKSGGNPDPVVYGYYQNKLKPDNLGLFSEFIKEILVKP